MQAWGYRSRFDNRDTGLEPTRSGIVGMLCAALGLGREADLTPFDSLRMGVRVDAPGRVAVDYHTATPIWRDGPDAPTVVSNRYYLADARFLVALQSDEVALLEKLEAAVRSPYWPLFLGRKSFVPSVPVHFKESGIRQGKVEDVLRNEPWFYFSTREKNSLEKGSALRLVLEAEPGRGVAINDVPRDFERRRYGVRYLTHITDFKPTQMDWHPLLAKEPTP